MKRGLDAKFTQNPEHKDVLINTGNAKIIEASTGRYWGSGRSLRDPDVLNTNRQRGKNKMGELLEAVRTKLL